jgi:hypothetical protein
MKKINKALTSKPSWRAICFVVSIASSLDICQIQEKGVNYIVLLEYKLTDCSLTNFILTVCAVKLVLDF